MMDIIQRIVIGIIFLMCLYLFWMWFCFGNCVLNWQKTRSPQQRRMYAGSRTRPSFSQPEPSIYVSPANLPPPPKYECMAPPSYEEVVGVHYPQFQPQPITQPIATAMAHESPGNSSTNVTSTPNPNSDTTVVTVSADDRRTSVVVATSS